MLSDIKWFIYHIQARYRLIRNHGKELNRRVAVENTLFAMAAGKQPLPDQDGCRKLAIKLGTPE